MWKTKKHQNSVKGLSHVKSTRWRYGRNCFNGEGGGNWGCGWGLYGWRKDVYGAMVMPLQVTTPMSCLVTPWEAACMLVVSNWCRLVTLVGLAAHKLVGASYKGATPISRHVATRIWLCYLIGKSGGSIWTCTTCLPQSIKKFQRLSTMSKTTIDRE